jgi:hypothetical protein
VHPLPTVHNTAAHHPFFVPPCPTKAQFLHGHIITPALHLTRRRRNHEVCKVCHSVLFALHLAHYHRELERDLVPEWRLKYLDYKVRSRKRTYW